VEYDNPHHRHAQAAMTSKVQVITSRRKFDACFAITWQRKSHKHHIIGGKIVRATGEIAHQFQGQRLADPGGCSSLHLLDILWRPAAQIVESATLHGSSLLQSSTRMCTLWRCKFTPTLKAKWFYMTSHCGPIVVWSVTEIPFPIFIWSRIM